jgi:hypothetical protein
MAISKIGILGNGNVGGALAPPNDIKSMCKPGLLEGRLP